MNQPPLVGQTLRSHYQIIQSLGSGGFGDTYLAQDLDLPGQPYCVVKHLKPKSNDPAVLPIAKSLFDREAQTLYQLGSNSEQIPRLFAHFEENGEFYLVQEFVDGHDLTREIIPGQIKPEPVTCKLLKDILEVLAVVHQKNVIHRDIKPQNLMRRKSDGKIVLIDFGAVKEIGTLLMNPQGQTSVSIAVGSPGYMPSEQARGRPKFASDVYAVGMMGIQAVTGFLPQQLQEDPETGEIVWKEYAQISDELGEVLDKMVRDHFSQRYQTASAALQALMPIIEPQSPPISQITPPVAIQPIPSVPPVTPVTPPPQPSPTIPSPPPTPQPKPSSTPQPVGWVERSETQRPHPPQPSSTPAPSRRKFITLLSFAGVGLGGVALWEIIKRSSTSPVGSSSSSKSAPPINLKSFSFNVVKVNAQGKEISRSQKTAQSFTEDLGKGVNLEMVAIPGGTFTMGSPSTEKERGNDEGPQHQVTIQSFYMGKFEVTQAQYEAIMGTNPSSFKSANRPVEKVSWNDAVEFCKRLSQKTGRTYRLPSEAEWEYACRAGTTTPFSFGETITTDLVNYNGNFTYGAAPKGKYRQQTTDVGSLPPNAFGLYDMHGNVWEWCADSWHDSYSGAPTDGSAWIDNDNQNRILRGGSWLLIPFVCRSAGRNSDTRAFFINYIGFRVVCLSGSGG
jgi:eukaryotic-like serine/threonine-protein kinase